MPHDGCLYTESCSHETAHAHEQVIISMPIFFPPSPKERCVGISIFIWVKPVNRKNYLFLQTQMPQGVVQVNLDNGSAHWLLSCRLPPEQSSSGPGKSGSGRTDQEYAHTT